MGKAPGASVREKVATSAAVGIILSGMACFFAAAFIDLGSGVRAALMVLYLVMIVVLRVLPALLFRKVLKDAVAKEHEGQQEE